MSESIQPVPVYSGTGSFIEKNIIATGKYLWLADRQQVCQTQDCNRRSFWNPDHPESYAVLLRSADSVPLLLLSESGSDLQFPAYCYYTENIIVGASSLLFGSEIFMKIGNRIAFRLKFTGIKWNATSRLWPYGYCMVNIIWPKTRFFNFIHRKIAGKLVDNGGNHLQMGQFVSTWMLDIMQKARIYGLFGNLG